MRPKLKAVVMPDCDKSMKSCDKCENFDAARRTQSCQAHERYSDAEVIAALTSALKELGVDVPVWRPIESAPKDGTPVLIFYKNRLDMSRIVHAEYIARFTEENYDSDECEIEYNEEKDLFYTKEGWYEQIDNWGDFSSIKVTEGVPTYWMPLPTKPTE